MKPKSQSRRSSSLASHIVLSLGLAMVGVFFQSAQAGYVYWDTNGATAGAGTSANGTWSATTSGFWTTDLTGNSATSNYDVANGGLPSTVDVVFSAGTDATSTNITLSGAVVANSITVEELLNITSATTTPSLTLGSGGVTINSTVGANTTTWISSLPTILSASQTWTNNASGLFTVNGSITGAASTAVTFGIAGTGNTTLSGAIANGASGTVAINKTDAGTLTLSSASNSCTGGLIIAGGVVSVGNNLNLGASTNAISLNGGTLRTTAGFTNTHAITIGASGGTINNAANANLVFGTANTLLGNGTLTITGNGAYALAGARAGVVPINVSNTFSGNVILQDGGLLEYGNANALASTATVTVNNNGTLSAQNVAIANDVTVNSGGVLAFQNTVNGSFTGNITLAGSTTVRLQNWWNTAVQNGLISGKITGTAPLTINSGTGTGAVLTLTNATSDYTGATTIGAAVVNIGTGGTLANVNTASSLGKGSVGGSSADLVINGGTLRYTGSAAQSTDRLFSVGTSNGTLDASGSNNANPLTFTGTGTMGFNSQTGTRTLTLTGTNTGTNGLALAIGDNSGATSITKTGAGTWALGGTNNYSGATTVSVGTLSFLNTAAQSASTTVTAAAGTTVGLGIGGTGFYSVADVNSLIANTLTGFSMNATTVAGIDTTAGDFTFDTTGQSGTRVLAKIGANKLILSGTNTYSGAFQIQTGTLEYLSATAMSSNSALTIGSGGTLSLRADANNTFTPASVSGSVGNYTIEVNQLTGAGAGKILTLANTFNIGGSGSNLTVSSTSGDTLLLSSQLAQFNASSPSATINLSGANMTLDAGVNYNGATNGPLLIVNANSKTMVINGTWTTGGNRWSGIQLNNGTLTMTNGQGGGSGTNSGVYAILNGGTLNLNNNNAIGGANAGNSFTINGGTLDNTSGSTKTLSKNPATTINGDFAFSTSGGTSANDLNLGTNTVSLGSAAGTSRTITANGSATLTLGGVISNGTTANSIIKAGPGTLALTNTGSTFSGGLTINAGAVIQGGNATGAQGGGTITLGDGATSASATLSGAGSAAITNTNAITIASGGSGTYIIAATTNSDYNFSGAVALNSAATFKVTSGGQLGFSNSITGSSQITIDSAGTGTKFVNLSGNNSSTFTGNVLIQNGNAGQSGLKLGASNALSNANTITIDANSAIDLGGFNLSVAGLNDVVTGAGGSKITGTGDIALGGGGTYSFSGVINGTGTKNFTKSGTGTQTLSGTNTYAGATAVQLGKLVVSGSIGNSAVTVTGTNTTLASGSTGTIGSTVTINNGAILAAGNTNAIGTATVGSGGTTMNSGSIFSWDLDTTAANTAGTGYDNVVTSSLAGDGGVGAVFAVVLKSGQSFGDTFWNSSHSWDNVFSTDGSAANALGMTSVFSSFTYNGSTSAPVSGAFTFTGTGGNTLTWSAVPEPTSALVGLLVGAGLLRRRRKN